MKVNRSKTTLIWLGLGFALLHYAVFTVSYVRSEVIHPGRATFGGREFHRFWHCLSAIWLMFHCLLMCSP